MIKKLIILIFILFIIVKSFNKKEKFTNPKQRINIYVINLDRERQKFNLVKKDLDKNNYNYTRFSAIDGKAILPNDNTLKKFFGNYKVKYSNGQKCCSISHLSVWIKISQNNTKYNIIIEDDVILPKNLYQKINNCMKQLPKDWDFLFLGGNKIIGTRYSKNIIKPLKKANKNKKVDGNYGTFAYVINSKNIKSIINDSKKLTEHIDVHIQFKLGKKYKIFFTSPQIIKHNYNSISSIQSRNRKHETIKRNLIRIID
tara:strand:+ start:316 stop:1086 length:771 start_codon:yes stop_codon:yes gene_type:complete